MLVCFRMLLDLVGSCGGLDSGMQIVFEGKKNKPGREEDRDVSERIALGQAKSFQVVEIR